SAEEQSVLHNLRLAQLAGHLAEKWAPKKKAETRSNRFLLASEFIDERYVVRDLEEIHQTEEHFSFNIHRMVDLCKASGVPVVLCVEASNLRDWAPFRTEPSTRSSTGQLQEQLRKADENFRNKRFRETLSICEEATAVDPRLAIFHFIKAKCL